jgi:hypothetical protein
MPLLRGVARTAVIAGTATAVSNRVSRRQANRWAAEEEQQYEQAPPPAAAAPAADPLADRSRSGLRSIAAPTKRTASATPRPEYPDAASAAPPTAEPRK